MSRRNPPRAAAVPPTAIGSGSAIRSPCTSVCAIDAANGWCAGCFRTIDEIATWASLDDFARNAVWKQLPARRAESRRLHVEVPDLPEEIGAGEDRPKGKSGP